MAGFRKTAAQEEALTLLGGPAGHILLFGGSRSGKSFILLYAMVVRALLVAGSRQAVFRLRANSVRQSVMSDTLPKLMRLAFGRVRYRVNRLEQCAVFGNGSEIWFCGLDSAERVDKILGKEFCGVYFNECSEIPYDSVTVAMTRLAQKTALKPRAYFDCNPAGRNHWCHKLFIEKIDPAGNLPLRRPEDYCWMRINPAANAANLPAGYLQDILENLPAARRKRFLLGEWSQTDAGALWQPDMIDSARAAAAPELLRVVVGVDPAVSSSSHSDFTGIVVAGLGVDRQFYVLDDLSCRTSPAEWARRVAAACRDRRADRVVAEVNNGGELVEALLRRCDENLSFKAVRASRGKQLRAEPVAALYERGLVHHVGRFDELEEEMCSFGATLPHSPDRLDALVWALTELSARPFGRDPITA